MTNKFQLLYSTCSSREEAKELANLALEKKLIACANIYPQVESVYAWQGKIETSSEAVLLMKTSSDKFSELEVLFADKHSYDCPCLFALDMTQVSSGFADFLAKNLD